MIGKLTEDGRFYPIKANELTEFLELQGYIEFNPKLKEDGTFYEFYNEDGTPNLNKCQSAETERYRAELKAYILTAVNTMAVGENTLDGIYTLFDGSEASTTRVQKAITALVGDEQTLWRVYDNSEVLVNQTVLGKVLRKAGVVQSKLWFCKTKECVNEIVKYHSEWEEKFKQTVQ